jgi:hypothetical protein
MPRLEEFREMIDSCDDQSVLESGQTLLREMIAIYELERKLKSLNDSLTDGGKAIFYFFAEELDEDEVVFAAERISGRLKRIERKKADDERAKEKDSSIKEQDDNEK